MDKSHGFDEVISKAITEKKEFLIFVILLIFIILVIFSLGVQISSVRF